MLNCQIFFYDKRYLLAMRKKFIGMEEYHDEEVVVVLQISKLEYNDTGVIIYQNDFNLLIPYDCYEMIQIFHTQSFRRN